LEANFYRELAYVFGAALVGGAAAKALRQPLIVGYVLGGILIGPFTPGPTISEIHQFEILAEIGVILLMYSIGLEFSFQELLTRMQTLLRRAQETSDVLTVGDLVLDPQHHTVERDGRPIKLSQREYALLEYLMRNAERTVTRTMVVEQVWNLTSDGLTSVVDVYISYLRAKVDQGFAYPMIQTRRGVGFMLSANQRTDKTDK